MLCYTYTLAHHVFGSSCLCTSNTVKPAKAFDRSSTIVSLGYCQSLPLDTNELQKSYDALCVVFSQEVI